MRTSINQLLPSNDLFEVRKETDVELCKYYRWNHVSWCNKLAVGDKLVSQGTGDMKVDGQKMWCFRKVNPETGELEKETYGMMESDLSRLMADGTLWTSEQYVSPTGTYI